MTHHPVTFKRARRPEHKAQLRVAILDAAARLATEKGVGQVSLGDIAQTVGMSKSNVLRYFETREDLYLQLTAAGYHAWTARAAARLQASPIVGPNEVASVLAEELATDPLFCDLLSHAPATLERNVSAEAARSYKLSALAAIEGLAGVICEGSSGLTIDQAREIVIATVIHATGLWPLCNPPVAVAELYMEDSRLHHASLDFVPRLARLIEVAIIGMVALDGRH